MTTANKLAGAIALGLAIAIGASSSLSQAAGAPERVWVKFKPGSKANVRRALLGAGGKVHYAFDGINAFAVSLPPQALQGIRNNPNVEYVEADSPRYPLAQNQPYGIGMVQAPQVWATGVTGNGMTVCVIDSGIHAGHEDLQGVAMSGYASPGQSWNTDTCGHGSHVAGTIAAKSNALGVVGVNTGSISLFVVKVFDGPSCGWSYSSTLVDAATRCANAGAKVINMSLGGAGFSQTESNAFQSLYDQGVLHVAAAGNAGNTQHSYPASYDSVISVAALDSTKTLATFSQRNNQVELAAPGVGVLSTVPQVSATTSVDGVSYMVTALEFTHQGNASGALVNGGRCATVGSWTGKTVLCERGDISFATKVNNVFSGGGAAAIIYNNVPGGFSGTLGTAGPAIPAVSMTQEDGQFLVANKLNFSANVSTVANNQGNGYAFYNGTSMATPHVAGVAALIWSANPSWTNGQIREALAVTAEDLGTAGRDDSYGWGLIRAKAALDELQLPVGTPPSGLTAATVRSNGTITGISLNWTTGTALELDLYRYGFKVATTANDGNHIESYVDRGAMTATYKVCIKNNPSACSNAATVLLF